ncbi:pantoate--beta-alanine ligase [Thermomicrobium sp.]|jgi:pantoate--beta-alanine ligase|uniref:pantoate--beta-alanine ligase n=1 Tax=Thermomicrobium sp. TaxID=1969469 RepID=UPI001B02F4B3|nr:pantoate--beta-alanine ligase [Thermomicrobium sp.]MBO9307506.1 pantoate--beta-alanine ligase [Thermomicrobium sp.]MBO9386755.1 pantoate--beta-alanine ligase [Thermomicrobium sp.]
MHLFRTIAELRIWRSQQASRSVGFVPTMGYLHEGHLALVRRARAENETVVVSIFVNPLQFGPQEDYDRYPRDLDRDLYLLEREGVDAVFAPSVSEMYPSGFSTAVVVTGPIAERLEGEARPGHFRGVATVVTRLFGLVQPQRAYFGWKDAQQVLVVQRLVQDLALPVDIVPLPTVREADGLAMSSRNVYLSPEERVAASAIPRALFAALERFRSGERAAAALRELVRRTLTTTPVRLEYVSVSDLETFQEVEYVERPALLLVAAWIGTTRLIDNVLLDPGAP